MEARLASETDIAGFRAEAQALLAHQVPPESVSWHTARAENSQHFPTPDAQEAARPRTPAKAASAIVPASFMRLCEVVALHNDPGRYDLLYRLLWRLVHEPGLRHDPIDDDMQHAHQMGQAVRRDIHKMKSLLRFEALAGDDGRPLQLAWHEPTHHILDAVAPWFAKRSPQQRWAIFTPQGSVEWDGAQLHYAQGVAAAEAPPLDASGSEWLACYRRVFRP